jgi:hypothetical protein
MSAHLIPVNLWQTEIKYYELRDRRQLQRQVMGGCTPDFVPPLAERAFQAA